MKISHRQENVKIKNHEKPRERDDIENNVTRDVTVL